ncbi:MAG TPA: hypothetical protein VEG38_00640 [Acidimicrobiia bacterium]|nr:hypothetical protein [Acidimicrobiia bacterium]
MTLHDADEQLHAPPHPLPSGWQENLFFVCWDTATVSGVVVHLQRAPGADVQAAQVVVAVDGHFGSATFTAPFTAGSLVPEVAATPIEPWRRWTLQLEGKVAAGVGPLGFLADRPGGDTVIAVDLTLDSRLPVADFAAGLAEVVAGMRADGRGPQMGDQQHYEQGGTWRGRLRVGHRERTTAGLFVRDHSWGIRHEHGNFRAFWTASCLDGGRLFCNAIGIPRDDGVIGIGLVADESGVRSTTVVGADFRPVPGIATYDQTTVTFGDPLRVTLVAESQCHVPIPLPLSGPNRYDNNALSRVRLGSSEGFGVMEWAAVLTDDEAGKLESGDRS